MYIPRKKWQKIEKRMIKKFSSGKYVGRTIDWNHDCFLYFGLRFNFNDEQMFSNKFVLQNFMLRYFEEEYATALKDDDGDYIRKGDVYFDLTTDFLFYNQCNSRERCFSHNRGI